VTSFHVSGLAAHLWRLPDFGYHLLKSGFSLYPRVSLLVLLVPRIVSPLPHLSLRGVIALVCLLNDIVCRSVTLLKLGPIVLALVTQIGESLDGLSAIMRGLLIVQPLRVGESQVNWPLALYHVGFVALLANLEFNLYDLLAQLCCTLLNLISRISLYFHLL
jgi:hypothetical protein